MSYSYLMKFIIVGDSGVGKSCLLNQYINKIFVGVHEITIGVEFAAKIVRIKDKDGNIHSVKIQIWDTAGQETFRSITQSYYKGAAAVILVYDITKPDSFENLKEWYNDIKQNCPDDVSVLIIGNKNDLSNDRKVSTEEATNFINKNNIKFPYYETSAKEYNSIDKIFDTIAVDLINKIYNDDINIEGVKYINGFKKMDLKKKSTNKKCCTIM